MQILTIANSPQLFSILRVRSESGSGVGYIFDPWIPDLGYGSGKKSASGSGSGSAGSTRIIFFKAKNPIFVSFEVKRKKEKKQLKHFENSDPGSGGEKIQIRDTDPA